VTISVVLDLPALPVLADDELLAVQARLGEVRRQVDAVAAQVAAEVARRSRPELGYDGLAQRLGARTPQKLVQQVTGSSARDAGALVRVGGMRHDDARPWLRRVGEAVAAGELSLEAADAVSSGLGAPTGDVTADDLGDAVGVLLELGLTPEGLAARARELRADLDLAGVSDREAALRAQRSLRISRGPDGLRRMHLTLDPESDAIVTAVFDAATSPRRGGPRFADPDERARAEALVTDERSTEQLALDTFVELLRLGAAVAPDSVLGKKRPAVTLHVTAADLERGLGVARFEGQTHPIGIDTARRMVCEVGALPVLFEGGEVVNLGREQRLFTRRQKLALAARDGGCIFPDCDRPPSWTEAHHIDEWKRDHGSTDIADGVLLCRHHHLLVHNNGWRVERDGAEYGLGPPPDIDPQQRVISARQRPPVARAG
jgi:hypothetical protein